MRVVTGWPPNIAKIKAEIPSVNSNYVFAYGDTIYSPSGPDGIDTPLFAHENVHRRQQEASGGPEAWWDRYLTDREFRFEQEVEAYRAQYRAAELADRATRRRLLAKISRDLASPMYGRLVSKERARALIAA